MSVKEKSTKEERIITAQAKMLPMGWPATLEDLNEIYPPELFEEEENEI